MISAITRTALACSGLGRLPALHLSQAARLRNGQGLSYLRPGTVAGRGTTA